MKNIENNINFHKLVKNLSTNALRYLINIAKQESFNRLKHRENIEFENKKLPKLYFTHGTIVKIKNEECKILRYHLSIFDVTTNQYRDITTNVTPHLTVPSYCIDVDLYKWEELVKDNRPIKITLLNLEKQTTFDIELHSRSKIYWFHKVLENATSEPFEKKFNLI